MIIGSITDQRLAFGTPAHACVQRSIHGHFIALLYPYIGLDNRQLNSLNTSDHHSRLRFIPLKHSRPTQTAFNTHNPCITQRVH
jgi:hypothetical protein